MKKIISLLLTVVLVFCSAAMVFAIEPVMTILANPVSTIVSAPDEIKIVCTNDVHCGYLAYDKLATVAKDADLLLDAGDAIQGDVIGTLSSGEYINDIMNYLGYDVATFGNHEFDYGMDQLKEIVKLADFPYVSCNLVELKTGKALFDAYKVLEVKGKKIAVIGITTPESFVKSNPKYFQDAAGNFIYGFCEGNNGQDLYDCVQKAIDAAKKEADYVIAIAHLGVDAESSPWTCEEVVNNVSGLDAIFDGHSHSEYVETMKGKDGKEVVAVQTGTKLANAGVLTIKNGKLSAQLVKLADVAADAEATAYIQSITDKFDALQKEVVAKTSVKLAIKDEDGKRIVRKQETNIGDLIADGARTLMDAEIAFSNGGGMRADINIGDITYGMIVTAQPFGNAICKAEVKGSVILDALELGAASLPNEFGGFLQVSGITYTINTAIPSGVVLNEKSQFVKVVGERRVSDVKVGGVAIDPEKTYTLAGTTYMIRDGGDGYKMLADNAKILVEGMTDNQCTINYIKNNLGGTVGSAYEKPQGRITIIEDNSKRVAAADCAQDDTCTLARFTDVKVDSWYHDGLHDAVVKGLFGGTSKTTISPENKLTRGEMITLLWNLKGKPVVNYAMSYTDVAEDAYYTEAVRWATSENIVSGSGDKFNPANYITRQELAAMLYNYEKHEGGGFTGAWMFLLDLSDRSEISSWAFEGVAYFYMHQVIKGTNGAYNPANTATRAEAAVLISQYLNMAR